MENLISDKIKKIKAREILDSRGNPTVEVEMETDFGIFQASVPSGASKGKYEALELRDGGERYSGKGVLKAVKNVNEIIAPRLEGKIIGGQKEIDQILIGLDGTENKSKLGANAVLPVSMAVCRASAASKKISLYQYIAEISESRFKIPVPCFNIVNGGAHAGNHLDFQEFMIVPRLGGSRESGFKEALRAATEIYQGLKLILKKRYGPSAVNIGDEGGFAPPLKYAEEALNLIIESVQKTGYKDKIKVILDVAASQFYEKGEYRTKRAVFTREGLLRYYFELVKKYPIIGIEDPFFEDDWEAWRIANRELGISDFLIIGDDLLATNPKRIKEAKNKNACNALLLKINQIGTVSEAIEAAKLARTYNWKIIVSHRSGETCDDFIADLAVGIGADFIKAGAPVRGERTAKYNRLLKIEENRLVA